MLIEDDVFPIPGKSTDFQKWKKERVRVKEKWGQRWPVQKLDSDRFSLYLPRYYIEIYI